MCGGTAGMWTGTTDPGGQLGGMATCTGPIGDCTIMVLLDNECCGTWTIIWT